MKTGAVIVAAGMSQRMGEFKPMMPIGDMSIIGRIIANFQQSDIFPIVVVTGFRAGELEKHVSKLGVICVRNADYATTEMITSAKIGLSFIRDACDRVFFTPADIPLFTYGTLGRLLKERADVVKPVCNGRGGHPILLDRWLVDQIIADDGTEGLHKVIERRARSVRTIPVADEGVLLDVDHKSQYDQLVTYHNQTIFRPALDISLMREGLLFDKDAALLLHMIAYAGTVKEASASVGMSYSKAWKMIAALERHLGFALLERQPGGEAGGASVLTERGQDLLYRYEQYVEAIKAYANRIFPDYFEESPCQRVAARQEEHK
jgi:molybdenum cofactor cytidylyltransferase